MILLLLAIAIGLIAYVAAKRPLIDNTWIEVARWAAVGLAWLFIGGILNGLAIFLLAQTLYNPLYNYFTGRDVWFIEDDTWYGKLAVKYLGENYGKTLFWIQLIIALVIILT